MFICTSWRKWIKLVLKPRQWTVHMKYLKYLFSSNFILSVLFIMLEPPILEKAEVSFETWLDDVSLTFPPVSSMVFPPHVPCAHSLCLFFCVSLLSLISSCSLCLQHHIPEICPFLLSPLLFVLPLPACPSFGPRVFFLPQYEDWTRPS